MVTMLDHPGWSTTATRALRTTNGPVLAHAHGPTITVHSQDSEATPRVDVYDPHNLSEHVPAQLRTVLGEHGPVQRLRNPDLWDAIATAIIRQVIRAGQARKMYHAFADAFGEPTPHNGPRALPAPEVVLDLTDEAFAELGMAFKRPGLRAAARSYAALGEKWAQLAPTAMISELQTVPRIGPWSAGAIVADYTGDFSLYPYGDMAVRKHARAAAPSLDLPNTAGVFAARWAASTTSAAELSTVTALTLALGGDRAPHPPEQDEHS